MAGGALPLKIKKIAGLGQGCSLFSASVSAVELRKLVGVPWSCLENWKLFWRAVAPARKLASWPQRLRAPSPSNGSPPPSLETGTAGLAAAGHTQAGRLVWPACLQAFLLEVCDPFELWETYHPTLSPLLS